MGNSSPPPPRPSAAIPGVGGPGRPAGPGRPGGYAALAVLAVLGAAVGLAGALVQGGAFPGGLVLALLGSTALFVGGATYTRSRAGAAVPTATWLLAVIYLTVSRPEGDFVFAAGLGAYLYLLLGALAGVMSATLSQPGRRGGPPDRPGG